MPSHITDVRRQVQGQLVKLVRHETQTVTSRAWAAFTSHSFALGSHHSGQRLEATTVVAPSAVIGGLRIDVEDAVRNPSSNSQYASGLFQRQMPDLRHLFFSRDDFASAVGDVSQPRRSEAVPLSEKIDRVAKSEIDAYLDGLDEPKRRTLQMLRRTILEIIPEAAQGISYGLPAFRVSGKVVAGFAAFKSHRSYLPHSGSVLGELEADLDRYKTSKGALQFSVDQPLPKQLVKKLIAVRRGQAGV